MHANKWKWKPQSKTLGCSKCGPKREVYGNTGLPQEGEKSQTSNLNLYLWEKENKQQMKPKASSWREIIILNQKKKWYRKKIEQINETKSSFFEKLIKLINL